MREEHEDVKVYNFTQCVELLLEDRAKQKKGSRYIVWDAFRHGNASRRVQF